MRALRKLLLVLLALLLLLLVAAAALWAFRDSLATFAFHRWAEAQGLEGEVEKLDLEMDGIEVQGLRLEEAQLARAELHFSVRELLRGKVKRLHLQGLKLPIDLTGKGPLLGRLQPLLGEGGKARQEWRSPLPEDPPALPAIRLEGSQLLLETARGRLPVDLQGSLDSGDGGEQADLRLLFGAKDPDGAQVTGSLEARLAGLRPQSLLADMELDWPHRGSGSLTLAAEALTPGQDAEVVARLEGTAADLSSLVPGLPEATAGQLDLALDGSLKLPPLPYLDVEPPASWLSWLAQREISARLQLAGQEVDVPAHVEGATFFAAIAARRAPGGTSLHADGPLEVHAAGIGPAVTEMLPDLLAERLEEGASLSIQPLGEQPLLTLDREAGPRAVAWVGLDLADQSHVEAQLEAATPLPATSARLKIPMLRARLPAHPLARELQLSGSGTFMFVEKATSGELALSLTAEDFASSGVEAERLELTMPLRFDQLGKALHLVLREAGHLTARGFAAPAVERTEELQVTLESLALELDLAEGASEGASGSLSAEARSSHSALVVGGLGRVELLDPQLKLDAVFDGTGLRQGALDLAGSSLYLAEQELTLTDFQLEAPLAPSQPLAVLRQARLYSDAVPALFPPLDLTGHLDRELRFELAAHGGDGAISLTANGQHDAEADRGSAVLSLAPLRFTPDGLQPSILGSHASGISDGRGQLQADARVTWSDGGLNGSLRLRARDLGFTYGGTALEGINSDFRLASLRPLRTAEPQRLEVRRIEPGVTPITDVALFVSVEQSSGGLPVLRLERGHGNVTDGLIRVESGSADPTTGTYVARVELERLDLEALLALIGLDELTGSGRISGTIPIELQGETVSVDQGFLQTDGPGVIAFRSPEARSALAAGGEYVSLMFDALENFHYELVEIGLTKPPTGTTRIHLRLLGANPDVMDAQPFDLNINVTTNAAPLLEALAESRRLQRDVTEQLWRLVR